MTGYSATIFSLAIARGQPRTVGAELPARAAWPDDSALVMTAARDTAELARRARTLRNAGAEAIAHASTDNVSDETRVRTLTRDEHHS